ncbi:MAG: hypothetical protein H0X71_09655 [Rubrobacter sp.]|nr:hypothetical protein [Rubrobacter sp.]
MPAHCSGVGKVLLASSEWDRVAALFKDQGMPALTPNTITTLDLLDEELRRVRAQGYAFDDEETSVGLCCVAAPIRDPAGKTIAAVSISAPAYRFHTKKKDYTDAVLDTARRISESARPKPKEFPDYAM